MQEQTHIQRLSGRVYGHPVAPDAFGDGAAAGVTRLIDGRYRLGARLGRGRLGEIFEAFDLADGDFGVERRKALQLLDPKAVSDPSFAERLAWACEALRTSGHSNLVQILDAGRDRQRHYLVMELLEGGSLRTVLDDAGPLPLEETLPVIRAVGDALAYLHAKGIVHGNVQPEQVFVTLGLEVKLLDIVPLRLREAPSGVRDDVYGLACLAYTLLSGRHPYNACSAREAQGAGLRLAPIALPAPTWAALERALALSPEERPASVAEHMRELDLRGTERLRPGLGEARAPPGHPDLGWARPEPGPPRVLPVNADKNRPRVQATPRRTARSLIFLGAATVLGGVVFLEHERLRSTAADFFAVAAPHLEGAWNRMRPPALEQPRVAASAPPSGSLAAPSTAPSPSLVAANTAPSRSLAAPAAVEPTQPVVAPTVVAPAPLPPTRADFVTADEAPPPVEVAEPRGRATAETAAGGEAEAAFRFAAPVIAVANSDSAARIVVERSGNATSGTTVVWWTTGGTAVADEDYADLGERTENLAAGELERAIFVPLIQDTVPEPTESFYVHVGRYDRDRRSLALVSSVRVDIRGD